MIYTIGAIIMAIGSLATWIYGLIQHNNSLKYQLAQKDAAAGIREWQAKIDASNNKVIQDERDYENAKNALNTDPSTPDKSS